MPDRHLNEQELDRFLNDLAAGKPAAAYDIAPENQSTVRALRSLAASPLPEPSRQRIAPVIQAEIERLSADPLWASTATSTAAPSHGHPQASQNGRAGSDPIEWRLATARGRRLRWPPTPLAVAALILLTFVAGLTAARFMATERTAMLIEAPDPPAVEILVDATVDSVAESWSPLSVERWTFQPGPSNLSIAPLDGPQWIVAEMTGLVATVDGSSHNLQLGEGFIVAAGQQLVLSNTGEAMASALRGLAAASFSHEEYDRAAISVQVALDTEAHEALPRGSSRVVMERLTLRSGTSLLVEPANGQDWLGVVAGRLGLTLVGDSLPGSWQSGREREFAPSDRLPALVPGTRVTLRSIGDDPLVLLRLRVMPLSESPT